MEKKCFDLIIQLQKFSSELVLSNQYDYALWMDLNRIIVGLLRKLNHQDGE